MAMQRDQFSYKSLFNAVLKIYNTEGARSFYSGLSVGLAVISSILVKGVAIYHGSGFFFFTIVKEDLVRLYPTLQKSKLADFTIGALGAIQAQLLSYPFDVLKKRMQG